MPVLIDEYRRYSLPLQEFIRLHFVPPSAAAVWNHYTPIMHHKFAFWMKDRLVDWLDPKPPAYRFVTAP
jgi:hypothetical protein